MEPINASDEPGRAGTQRKTARGWPAVDADVIVAGAGPTGVTVTGERCLAGVEQLVLERLPL